MTDTQVEEGNWYVVRTKQNAEKKVAERFRLMGIELFLPLYETIRIWSDRKKKLKLPLIPGHLFVFMQAKELVRVYQVPGISGILTEFGKPAVVRPHEIENLRVLSSMNHAPEWKEMICFDAGDEVEIVDGPFRGLFGMCVQEAKGYQVQITFKDLHLGFVLNVKRNQLRKL